MEQKKLAKLPVVGQIQHGEKINNKVTEYGYFIAKTKNEHMQSYIEKFNTIFKGKKSIEIEFFNEDPLIKKYVRYNQSGTLCGSFENSDTASLKTSEGWKTIKCNKYECQYRKRNEKGKFACNRIGWLKFLIPSICKDRIFLMKITGQTSIDQIDDYITLQKIQGKSIIGRYTLLLYQKEQTNIFCDTYKNYVVDIVKKEEIDSNKTIPQISENPKELSTYNTQNVDNKVEEQEKTQAIQKETKNSKTHEEQKEENIQTTEQKNTKVSTKKTTKAVSKKETKSKSKKEDLSVNENEAKTLEKTENNEIVENININNCYVLLRTFNKKIINKGQPKDYLMGEFSDMNDKISEIAINPEYSNELIDCDLGTVVTLDIKNVGDIKFAMKLEFVEKKLKQIAA